jgi:hypothetical protein
MRGWTTKDGTSYKAWSDNDVINTAVYGKSYGKPVYDAQVGKAKMGEKFIVALSKDGGYRNSAISVIKERGLESKYQEAKTWAPAGAENSDNTYKPPAVNVAAPYDEYNGEASMGSDSTQAVTSERKGGKRSLKISKGGKEKVAQGLSI